MIDTLLEDEKGSINSIYDILVRQTKLMMDLHYHLKVPLYHTYFVVVPHRA